MTQRVCVLPKIPQGVSPTGPVSFTGRIIDGLQRRGIEVVADPLAQPTDALLVIAGTKRLDVLLRARQRGTRIVQRLNGMNWAHRKRFQGVKHYLRSEWGNWLLATIRGQIAHRIVYQSQFSRDWWRTMYGDVRTPGRVIYNAVDLKKYTPDGPHQRPDDHFRIMMVEGNVGGSTEQGLLNGVQLTKMVAAHLDKKVELVVTGGTPEELRRKVEASAPDVWVTWAGVVKSDRIAEHDRSAHLFFSAELNAACPNSVIEALACGVPVVAFATGSLPELIQGDAGRVAPYGGNPWNLELPEIPPLVQSAEEILSNQARFSRGARARAEAMFDIEPMIDRYMDALLGE